MARRVSRFLVVAVAAVIGSACTAMMGIGRDSPLEARLDLRLSPELTRLGLDAPENVDLRPTLAYELAFGNGTGHGLLAGAQARFRPGPLADRRWWVGGEGLYALRVPGPSHSARFGGLLGIPLFESAANARWSTHLSAAGGMSLQSGGTGFYVRVGLEWNPIGK